MYQVSAENLALVLPSFSSLVFLMQGLVADFLSLLGRVDCFLIRSCLFSMAIVDLQCVWPGYPGLSAQLAHMN